MKTIEAKEMLKMEKPSSARKADMFLRGQDSPIFLLCPIGGTLGDIAALLTSFAVITAKRWIGWWRWLPLAYFLVTFFAINLPIGLGVVDDPSMAGELTQGVLCLSVLLLGYRFTILTNGLADG
jgi:hypothetical protein